MYSTYERRRILDGLYLYICNVIILRGPNLSKQDRTLDPAPESV